MISGFPPCRYRRWVNAFFTHSLLNGPPHIRNSVYSHSSAFQVLNFFFAMCCFYATVKGIVVSSDAVSDPDDKL